MLTDMKLRCKEEANRHEIEVQEEANSIGDGAGNISDDAYVTAVDASGRTIMLLKSLEPLSLVPRPTANTGKMLPKLLLERRRNILSERAVRLLMRHETCTCAA